MCLLTLLVVSVNSSFPRSSHGNVPSFRKFNIVFKLGSACSGVHFLLSVYSLCGVLPTRRANRLRNLLFFWLLFDFNYVWLSKISLFSTEKLWVGLENFVFDWLINADR